MTVALMVNGYRITKEYLDAKCAEYNIPDHMSDGLFLYLTHGIHPGSFLTAVLANDLMAAVAHADARNSTRLKEWAQLIYFELPTGSHGSYDTVRNWMEGRKGEQR